MNHHLRKKARLTSFLQKALKPFFAVCALAPVFAFHTASAQNLFWDANGGGGGSGTWDLATSNWGPAANTSISSTTWTQGSVAVFGSSSTPGTVTISVGNDTGAALAAPDILAAGLTFDVGSSTANAYTITDDNSAHLVFTGNAVVTVATGVTGIISTTLNTNATTDTLTFTGAGTVYLTSNNAATYTGASVTVTGGATLAAAGVSALANVATIVGTGGTGGTLDLYGSGVEAIASLSGDSSGTVTNSQSTYSNLTIGGPTTPNSPTTFAGTITDTAASVETTNNTAPTGGLGLTILGPATGYTLILTGTANTYHGMTVIGDGSNPATLQAGAVNAFSVNSAVDVEAKGTLDLNGFSQTIAALNGAGTGNVTNTSVGTTAVLTLNGDGSSDTLSSSANLIDHATNLTYGTLALTKNGDYTQVLAGNNTYGGATTVNTGTLANGSTAGFSPNSAYTVISPGILDLNGFDASLGSLSDGGTTGGTVENGSGTVTGSTPSNLVTLTTGSNNTSTTFSGLITDGTGTGTLALTKTGSGTFAVTDDLNAYSGGTNLNKGVLSFVSGALGSGVVTFTGNSTLQWNTTNGLNTEDVSTSNGITINPGVTATFDTNGNSVNFATGLSTGAGSAVTKTGLGTLTLTGANTYDGATTVNNGTLQAGSAAGFSSASAFVVTTNGTLDVNGFAPTIGSLAGNGAVTDSSATPGSLTTGNDNTNTTFSGLISDGNGTFALTKIGSGTFTLTNGANSYSAGTNLAGGTLSFANGALGSGLVTFTGNSTLQWFGGNTQDISTSNGLKIDDGVNATIDTNGSNVTFASALQTGLNGTGELTKIGAGALTLAAANTYSGGTTLEAGALVIANSGALGKGNVAINGGVLQAGGSNTNIQVNGNYTQSGAGELDLRIGGTAAGQFDRLTVVGSAALAGRLSVSSVGSFVPVNGESFTVITAGGGVTGKFQKVPASLASAPMVKLTVDYLPSSVLLQFSQASFVTAATTFHLDLTPNQEAVSEALDHISSNDASARLLGVLDSLPIRSLPAAYDLIAPAEYGAIYEISRSIAKMEAATVENRLDEVHAMAAPAAAAGPAGPSDDKGSKEVMPPPENRLSVFANGSGEFVSVGDSSNAAGYNFDSGGVTAGVDYRFTDHFVAGVLLNYTGTEADLVDNGRLNANTFRGGVYASLFGDGAYVNAFVGAGYNDYDATRAGLGGPVRGDTDGSDFDALIATGYDAHAGNFTYGPVASFQYTYTGLDSFNETGSLDPLHINSGYGNSYLSNVGVRATYDWHIGSMVLVPEVRATWQHEYGDVFDETSATMLLGSPAFAVTDSPIGRDSLVLNAGFTLRISPLMSAYAFYDGELARTNYQANNVMVGFRYSF